MEIEFRSKNKKAPMINKLRKYQMGSFLDIFEYFTQKNWAGIILRYNIFDNFIANNADQNFQILKKLK